MTPIPTDRPLPADDWIDWHGGENPVPGENVDVEFRSGVTNTSGFLSDDWGLSWRDDGGPDDIIAYRVSRPTSVSADHVVGVTEKVTSGASEGGATDFDVKSYVAEYEFRGDGGDYKPTEGEQGLLIDAIHGVIAELSDRALTPSPPVQLSERERALEGALRRLFEEKRPAYHDCIDAGEAQCAWCDAEETLAALTRTTGEG